MKKILAMAVIGAFSASIALAHQGATGIVKERMDAMKDVAGLVKALNGLSFQNKAADQKAASDIAQKLEGHANRMVSLFPEGSLNHPSEATMAIWEKPGGFAAIAQDLVAASQALKADSGKLSSNGDVKPHIRALGATCSACHKDYRIKK